MERLSLHARLQGICTSLILGIRKLLITKTNYLKYPAKIERDKQDFEDRGGILQKTCGGLLLYKGQPDYDFFRLFKYKSVGICDFNALQDINS